MQILLTAEILKRLHHELRRAGRQEIGGLLMGEHVSGETFRVIEISVQRSGGSNSHFIRDPSRHREQLEDFFARNNGHYERFNYLGEWHSHPSFDAVPSPEDLETMKSIVRDPNVGVNFLVLMVVKLSRRQTLEASAVAFKPHTSPLVVQILAEAQDTNKGGRLFKWLRNVLRI